MHADLCVLEGCLILNFKHLRSKEKGIRHGANVLCAGLEQLQSLRLTHFSEFHLTPALTGILSRLTHLDMEFDTPLSEVAVNVAARWELVYLFDVHHTQGGYSRTCLRVHAALMVREPIATTMSTIQAIQCPSLTCKYSQSVHNTTKQSSAYSGLAYSDSKTQSHILSVFWVSASPRPGIVR